jgi:hypothetical protein
MRKIDSLLNETKRRLVRRANMNAQHQVNQQVGSGSQPVFSTD